MSTLSFTLPDSLHEEIELIAKNEGISVEQFISSAVAEKMSALLTEKYLIERARRGDAQSFFEAMSKVPDVEPEQEDKL
jgi:hypothetical protein